MAEQDEMSRQAAHRERQRRRLAHADRMELALREVVTTIRGYARNGPLSTKLREIAEAGLAEENDADDALGDS